MRWRYYLIPLLGLLYGCASLQQQQHEQNAAKTRAEAEVVILRGDSALAENDLDRALYEYVQALNIDENNVEAHNRIGDIHSFKGNLAFAEQAYRKSLSVSKNNAKALEGLGLVLMRQQQHAKANALFTLAVKADPHRWRAHNGLGVLADLHHEYQQAQMHYQKALSNKPELPMLLTNLGYSKYSAGDWQAASELYQHALEKDPNYAKAWSNLGLLQVRQGKYEQATNTFTHIMPEPQAANMVGQLCLLEGKYKKAEEYLSEAIRRSPSYYEVAQRNLARAKELADANRQANLCDGDAKCDYQR